MGYPSPSFVEPTPWERGCRRAISLKIEKTCQANSSEKYRRMCFKYLKCMLTLIVTDVEQDNYLCTLQNLNFEECD